MKQAIQGVIAKNHWDVDSVYVLLDTLCIPQESRLSHVLAVNCLYSFAKVADAWIGVCPTCTTSGAKRGSVAMTRESYENQVWSRAEILARCCAHGVDQAYIVDDSGLQACTQEWAASVACVFEGQMACCQAGHAFGTSPCEMVSLVVPLLGLYFDCFLRSSPKVQRIHSNNNSNGHCSCEVAATESRSTSFSDLSCCSAGVSFFQEAVYPRKDRIFPSHFRYLSVTHKNSSGSRQPLFASLLKRVQKRAAAAAASACLSVQRKASKEGVLSRTASHNNQQQNPAIVAAAAAAAAGGLGSIIRQRSLGGRTEAWAASRPSSYTGAGAIDWKDDDDDAHPDVVDVGRCYL